MKKLLLLGLFLAAPCYANTVPTWTTGSSNRTENTTQTIDRTIVTEKYGSALNTWEATNITTRAAGAKIEEITQTDAITTTSVITSLSVFSQ